MEIIPFVLYMMNQSFAMILEMMITSSVAIHTLPKKGRIMRLRSVSSGIKPEFPLCAAQHGLFSRVLL
ncbi:MAG: hypothetical protein LBH28_08335, partial [Oscillospiraceae bacterium]|nr:hypothetical protein [Oscillospiraceae bacterium]